MTDAILPALLEIEQTHHVRVLFAVESGSRAWGFASPDSDYDVRFIYAHQLDDYLTVTARRDVIEVNLPGDLDLAGWDLRKALGLLGKSNPALFEWLQSPIVYRQDPKFVEEFSALAEENFSDAALWRHYVSMARTNWNTYFKEEEVPRKKYLYVMRPILAARWIEQFGTPPPTDFAACRQETLADPAVSEALDQLLAAKAQTGEMGRTLRDPVLDTFLFGELERLTAAAPEKTKLANEAELDAFFRRWIRD